MHRIQRVPSNEKHGRRHSSTVTVIAAGQAAQVKVSIDRTQVRVDTLRGTGPGGQHRNKTDSGVRLTHTPTGTVVSATEDRSQHVNRTVAWGRLQAALEDRERGRQSAELGAGRRAQFGGVRDWTWVGWRDTVTTPDGVSMPMGRALRGGLTRLVTVA